MLEIYTDGGCRNNPGIGAWAIVVVENNAVVCSPSCAFKYTTNNEMELSAIYQALLYLKMFGVDKATIYSDSQYSVNAITVWYQKWVNTNSLNGKKNTELLAKIHDIKPSSVDVVWVKGHADNQYNIMADKLVNDAMDSFVKLHHQ